MDAQSANRPRPLGREHLDTAGLGRGDQMLIEGTQSRAFAQGEFEIGRIIGGQFELIGEGDDFRQP